MTVKTSPTGSAAKGWRSRLPVLTVVVALVAAVVAAMTGAAKTVDAMGFVAPGHWVYNSVQGSVFHIDGSTSSIDSSGGIPGDYGDQVQVVQGDTSGYVVGSSRITEFGKSDLEVVEEKDAAAPEVPVGVEVSGGPYLVYRNAGKIVRLGEDPMTLSADGPLGDPVAMRDGTLWLPRDGSRLLCKLPRDADKLACPVVVPEGDRGVLSVVDDRPVFIDTTADKLYQVTDTELGEGRDLGVDVPDRVRVASSDVAGRIAILDPNANEMHLIDAAGLDPNREPGEPGLVQLGDGDFDGPMSTGDAVAVMDRESRVLTTYDQYGEERDKEKLGDEADGDPRLSHGEDDRIYVDGAKGDRVLVVDRDGEVSGVDVNAESAEEGGDTPAKPDTDTDPRAAPPAAPAGPPGREREGPEVSQQPPRQEEVPAADPGEDPRSSPPAQETPPPQQDPPPPPPLPASPPGAPTAVSARAGNASATVSWGAAADNRAPITRYTVSWAGGSRTVGGGAGSVNVPGLTNGTAYTFTVSATNSAGTGAGARSNAVTPVAPKPPTKITVTRGPDTDQGCDPPDCAFMHVVLTGFEPNTTYLLLPHSTDPGYSNEGASLTTDANGWLDADRFAYYGVGHRVWVTVDTPSGTVKSNELPWAAGEGPQLVVSRGDDTSSDACAAPDCAWLHVVMNGFEPNTDYTITGWASEWQDFSEPSVVTTDSEGHLVFEDIRFDGGGQTVWVYTETPAGRVESNRYLWEDR